MRQSSTGPKVNQYQQERLQKVLARSGMASRRELEKWISAGRISINGQVAELGARVCASDIIRVDGKVVNHNAGEALDRRVIIYNKAEGEICSRKDPDGRASVYDNLPRLKNGRWVMVGRLDYNTSGLLLFTNDGGLANALMHPSNEVEREYLCRIMGEVTDEMLLNLTNGVELEDGEAQFKSIEVGAGEGINRWFSAIVMEGRNREVRRLWESQGLQVSRLKRIRYGAVRIPHQLKRGQWQEMPGKDVNTMSNSLGLDVQHVERKINPEEQDAQRRLRNKRSYWRGNDRYGEKGRGQAKSGRGNGGGRRNTKSR